MNAEKILSAIAAALTGEAVSPRLALKHLAGIPAATAAFKAAVWARTALACA